MFFNIFMQSWIGGHDRRDRGGRPHLRDGARQRRIRPGFETEQGILPRPVPRRRRAGPRRTWSRRDRGHTGSDRPPCPGSPPTPPSSTAPSSTPSSGASTPSREREVNLFNLTDRDDGIRRRTLSRTNGANECRRRLRACPQDGPRDRGPAAPEDRVGPVLGQVLEPEDRRRSSGSTTGVYDEDVILVPFDRLSRILVLGGGTQQLFVYADDAGDSRAGSGERSPRRLGPGNVVREWTDNYWVAVLRQSSFLFYVIFGVFQVVASFLIINTVLMVIHERIKEIGMMGALGMTRAGNRPGLLPGGGHPERPRLGRRAAWSGAWPPGSGPSSPSTWTTFTGGGMKDMPVSSTIFLEVLPGDPGPGLRLRGRSCPPLCTLIPSLKSAFIEPVEALRR
ncbi:MAG: hypothetical protein MZU95_07810 [Desulfomicrobium escambiense]|nr:hypothetical protein [Desulfomicrobium escambiense]